MYSSNFFLYICSGRRQLLVFYPTLYGKFIINLNRNIMKLKRINLALFAIALGLAVPTLSSCSDDDDSNKIGVEYYSGDAAKTYLHDTFYESFDKLYKIDVDETQFAALQNLHAYFHEKYATYTIDGNSQVFTSKEIFEKVKKIFSGEASKDVIKEKLGAVAGTYKPDDATHKWIKTAETPGVIKLVFKDKNGKDASMVLSWANIDKNNGGMVQSITGENLDFSISLLDLSIDNNTTVLKVKLGRLNVASTTMSTKTSNIKNSIVYIDNNPIITSTKTSSGKNLNDNMLGNDEYEKVLVKTVFLDKIIWLRTNTNYQAVKEAFAKKYASQDERLNALADVMNANIKSSLYDTEGKLLCYGTKVVKTDNGNTIFSDKFTAGDGNSFYVSDIFDNSDKLKSFSERLTNIVKIIKNLGADVDAF